ncbi:hypothetical protein RI367_004713 [Sorochytrium milnesiophthora]
MVNASAAAAASTSADNTMTWQTDSDGDSNVAFPPLSRADVDRCQMRSWLPLFRRHTLRTELVPLPPAFVEYLLADGIKLSGPESQLSDTEDESTTARHLPFPGVNSFDDAEEDDVDNDCDEDDLEGFPEVSDAIATALTRLGGTAFPKLNWSAPKDASSDFAVHDLEHAYELVTPAPGEAAGSSQPEPVVLALRKWHDLLPSLEFRCFVRNQRLYAVTQRDTANHYKHLIDRQDEILDTIEQFFEDVIQHRFLSENYAFDVYLSRSSLEPFVMDFSPFAASTDPLLFSWQELLELGGHLDNGGSSSSSSEEHEVQLRLVESRAQGDQYAGKAPAYSANRVPKDVVDLSSGASIAEFAENWERELQRATANSD